jgi:hypothetical protein
MLGFTLQAQVNVTFRVDMNVIALNPGISPNGVHIAGSFQGWDPGADEMTDPDLDGIYEITFSIPNGTMIEWKYINSNAWDGNDETNNRMHTVTDNGMGQDILPIVCFNSTMACTNTGVTFRVDLTDEVFAGNFDPATGKVYVAGNFQGWVPDATELTDPDGDKVYTLNTMVTPGPIEYKFVKNGSDWENVNDPNGDCTTNGNRFATVAANTTLPIYCFNRCGACQFTQPPDRWRVVFQVDMTNMIQQFGGVDTTEVHVAGAFQGWNPTDDDFLMADPDGDGIYVFEDSLFDGAYQFKYLYGDDWGFDETGLVTLPCGMPFGGNRSVEVAGADVILDPICFNECDDCDVLPEKINLTWLLDLSSEIPNANGVFMKGSFQWPQFKDGVTQMTHIGNGIYSYSQDVVPLKLTFKFSNGPEQSQNETAKFTDLGCGATGPTGSQDRLLDLTGVTSDTIIGFIWNTCETFTSVKDLPTAKNIRIAPNPFSLVTVLKFDNPGGEKHDLLISSLTGQLVRSYRNLIVEDVEILRGELPAGVYFATLRNENGNQTTLKLVMN